MSVGSPRLGGSFPATSADEESEAPGGDILAQATQPVSGCLHVASPLGHCLRDPHRKHQDKAGSYGPLLISSQATTWVPFSGEGQAHDTQSQRRKRGCPPSAWPLRGAMPPPRKDNQGGTAKKKAPLRHRA